MRLRNASIKHSENVKKGEMSLRQVSEVFGVPKSMLHDRIMGKVLFGSYSGPRRFLSEKEEEELVVFLTRCYSSTEKAITIHYMGFILKKAS